MDPYNGATVSGFFEALHFCFEVMVLVATAYLLLTQPASLTPIWGVLVMIWMRMAAR